MTTFWLVALATCYTTYVVAKSDFPLMERIRVAVFERWEEGSWQAYLATCAWCVSAYTAGTLTAGTVILSEAPRPVLVWLGAAAISGAFHQVIDLVSRLTILIERRTR